MFIDNYYSGLDASIGYEADRPENIGEFINSTLAQVRYELLQPIKIELTGIVSPFSKRLHIHVRYHCTSESGFL